MPALWLSVAALTLVTLVVILWPWFRTGRRGAASQAEANIAIYRGEREQVELDFREGRLAAEEHAKALAEIEARILEDVARQPAAPTATATSRFRPLPAALAIALLVPVAAVGLYLVTGTPSAPLIAASSPAPSGQASEQDVRNLADQLAERLKAQPNDVRGWTLLARTNHAIGRYDIAGHAYARAVELQPNDADLYADWAEMLVDQSNGDFSGRPVELARKALAIDPDHLKALALLATAAWSGGDTQGSLALWQKVLGKLPEGSEDANHVKGVIAQLTGGPPPAGQATTPMPDAQAPATGSAGGATASAAPSAAGADSRPGAAPGGSAISGTVTVKRDLQARLAAGDTLFIFARAPEGPRMPIAAMRTTAKEFPFAFRLDDSLAMAGGPPLSSAASVVIEARVSKSGEARAQAGDLAGRSAVVAPGASGVAVVIDTVVP